MPRLPAPLIRVARLDTRQFALAVAAHAQWATPHEQERAAGFVDPEDRFRYLAAHWHLRGTVSARTGTHPFNIRLHQDDTGRPHAELTGGRGADALVNVSLSHSGGWAAAAVAEVAAVGIDIEVNSLRSGAALHSVSRRFHPQERDALARLAPAERPRGILRLWTLKEAYAKALGTGLSPFLSDPTRPSLDSCAFDLGPASPAITAPVPEDSTVHLWRFSVLQLPTGLTGACAVADRGSGRSSSGHCQAPGFVDGRLAGFEGGLWGLG